MRSRLADYQLLGAIEPFADTWLASSPPRLGWDEQVVVTALAADHDWAATEDRIGAIAAVRSAHLPTIIEIGRIVDSGETVTWCARTDGRPQPLSDAPVDPVLAYRLMASVACGLHDLHEAGVAHGELGPSCVLRRGDDILVEPPVHRTAEPALPSGGAPVDLDTIDPASLWGEGPSRAGDIWSLGAVAHRLLTGVGIHPALAGDQIVTAVQRVLIEPPAISSALPAAVADLVRRCLAPDPGDRPGTAAEVADHLEQLAGAR